MKIKINICDAQFLIRVLAEKDTPSDFPMYETFMLFFSAKRVNIVSSFLPMHKTETSNPGSLLSPTASSRASFCPPPVLSCGNTINTFNTITFFRKSENAAHSRKRLS